jgi:hypothetical protein
LHTSPVAGTAAGQGPDPPPELLELDDAPLELPDADPPLVLPELLELLDEELAPELPLDVAPLDPVPLLLPPMPELLDALLPPVASSPPEPPPSPSPLVKVAPPHATPSAPTRTSAGAVITIPRARFMSSSLSEARARREEGAASRTARGLSGGAGRTVCATAIDPRPVDRR